ncbi:MAG: helicase-exonuclease AddAB subunit AddA [Anaerovoracaceae bacterium]|nr:helicase-exonuclease AddAB subunit AddA [Anaerovoracaceae bacterium]
MNWTEQQRQAIEQRGKNLLVAAAAGSGKTAVLVERIKRLILEDGCPIDRMLIVTFTNAAASEMKEKIRRAVSQSIGELAQQLSEAQQHSEAQQLSAAEKRSGMAEELQALEEKLNFLKQQMNKLSQAQISTFHAFALEVIRKYFYIIDVEPNFKICDDAQQTLLKADAMDQLLEEQFEEDDPAFLHFLDCYSGDRNDDKFRELIEKAYTTIQSLPEPAAWLHEKVEMLRGARTRADEEPGADESSGADDGARDAMAPVMDFLWQMAASRLQEAEKAIGENARLAREAGMEQAVTLAEDDLHQLKTLREVMETREFDDFRQALGAFKLGTLRKNYYNPPEGSSMTPEESEAMKNAAAARRDLAKDHVKSIRTGYFSQSAEDMTEEMALTYSDAVMTEKLVNRYGQLYSEEKKKRGLVDFSDIEHYAWEILKDEEVSGFYREKFLHIFVDEYQDSNVMQEALLSRICRENNLFLVGDVKQSIYKFRLAEPEIFQKRYRDYAEGGRTSMKIDLNRNFRSKKPVIDFVNQVFDGIMDGYDEDAALYMGDPYGDRYYDEPKLYLAGVPWSEDEAVDDELKNMMKAEKEALAAVKLIRDSLGQPIYDSKAQTMRPLQLRDMVILLRGVRGYGDIFYNVLMENDIPAFVDDNDGYFDTMEINTFLSLLSLLDNEKQDVPLLTVLRSEIFGFSVEELASVRIACKEGSYYDAFMACGRGETGCDAALCAKSAASALSLSQWQSLAVFMPLEELIWKLLLDTGFYIAMGAMPGGRQRQANLRALVDKAAGYRKSQGGSLYGFIRYIEAVKEKKVASGQVKLVGEGDELVKIMTIHKSKGLEFPMVILAGFCRKLNYTRMGRSLVIHKDLGLGFPVVNKDESWFRTTALQSIIKEKFHQEEVEEEKRILYVALTRAKDRLAILGICEDVQAVLDQVGSQPPKDTTYFQMTGNRICTRLQQYEIIEDADLAGLVSHRQRRTDLVLDLFDRDNHTGDELLAAQVDRQMRFVYPYERDLAIKSKYSVSELNAAASERAVGFRDPSAVQDTASIPDSGAVHLEEPASFKQRNVFTPAQKGTIYHCLLEHLDFRTAYAGGDRQASLAVVEATLRYLVDGQFLTAEEAAVIQPENILKLMTSELGRRLAESPAVHREQPFNLLMEHDPDGSGQMAQVMVQGVIDCCFEENDGQLVLVDYKTSRIRPDREPEKEKQRIADHYRVQIDIYRRALETTTGKKVKEAYLYLTDSGELVEM